MFRNQQVLECIVLILGEDAPLHIWFTSS